MDRSFLSDKRVVAASRNFVCIRLATYEDKAEADFMKTLFISRSGQLENTTFCLLDPDGKRKLSRPGRGPNFAFRDAAQMTSAMSQITSRYPNAKRNARTDTRLPKLNSLELALNVAACDNLPLVVTYAPTSKETDQLEQSLTALAWTERFAGQFLCASAVGKSSLKPIPNLKGDRGIVVVEPGPYGLTGKPILQLDPSADRKQTESRLRYALLQIQLKPKDYRSHIQFGIQLGIDWKSKLPVTDQQSLRARERSRGR